MDKKEKIEKVAKKKQENLYNPKLLREMIGQGMSANEIMETMKLKHRQTLKQHILKLITDDNKLYEVKGLYLKNSNRPKVNAKLEIKISLEKIDLKDLQLSAGDEFSVHCENDMIILTKV